MARSFALVRFRSPPHLDQRGHVLDHVLGSLPEYLVAVARSDSVEGFLDVLFEVLHFDDVLNLGRFAGTDRGAVTPGIEEVEVRGVKVRYVAERFRDSFALGLHGDLGFRHGDLRSDSPAYFLAEPFRLSTVTDATVTPHPVGVTAWSVPPW